MICYTVATILAIAASVGILALRLRQQDGEPPMEDMLGAIRVRIAREDGKRSG